MQYLNNICTPHVNTFVSINMIGLNTDIVNHKDMFLTILVYFLRIKVGLINYNIKKLSLIVEGIANVKSMEYFLFGWVRQIS